MPAQKTGRAVGKGRKRVTFEARCAPGASVFLAGTFNHWDPSGKPMLDATGEGRFMATCMLAPGSYEYKFVVDGEWTVDEGNANFVVNALGSLNSTIEVS